MISLVDFPWSRKERPYVIRNGKVVAAKPEGEAETPPSSPPSRSSTPV